MRPGPEKFFPSRQVRGYDEGAGGVGGFPQQLSFATPFSPEPTPLRRCSRGVISHEGGKYKRANRDDATFAGSPITAHSETSHEEMSNMDSLPGSENFNVNFLIS